MKVVGYLALDLARTASEVEKPAGAVRGWLGKFTDRFDREVEQEALGMAALLDAVIGALAARKHDNLIRLMVGETTVYDDHQGVANDLEAALSVTQPEQLATADRLQLIVEEEDDDDRLYVVLNVLVYRRHAPGAYPVWIRASAIEKDLLRRPDEKPRAWRARMRTVLDDPKALVAACEADVAGLRGLLEALDGALRERLTVEASRVEAHVELAASADDYFLSLRPEYWDAANQLIGLAGSADLPPEVADPTGTPLRELVEGQAAHIEALEQELLPEGGRGTGAGAATWTAFSQRRVFNPRTGNIVKISSLSPPEQHPYRMLFNRAVPGDEQVELAGWTSRWLGRVRRGITDEVAEELGKLRDVVPQTYAFLKNKRFRRKVMKRSAKLMGQELIDTADTLAHTIVNELIETGKVPFGWVAGNKVFMSEDDYRAQEEAREQMLDMGELVVGTLVPLGAFALGGPLGGVVGLAGIKCVQGALNWFSKRSGGREWSILPSAWHERSQALDNERAPERAAEKVSQRKAALATVQRQKAAERERLKGMQKQLAENFRDFGRRLQAGDVDIEQLLDVSSLKETDIQAAIAEEQRVAVAAAKAAEPPKPTARDPRAKRALTADSKASVRKKVTRKRTN